MDIRTKHRIVNTFSDIKFLDAAGAETADKTLVETIVIPGFATLEKDAYVAGSYLKTAASAGVKEVADLTVSGSASAVGRNSVSLNIEVLSGRQEAEYSRYSQFFGKILSTGVVVPASATAADIVAEIKKNLDARVSRFDDLPFTYTVLGGVITVTSKLPHIVLGSVSLSISDKDESDSGAATVAKAVTTAGVAPVGQGSQIEESVSFLTASNALAGGMKADERVDTEGTYDEYQLEAAFTDALAAAPQAQGLGGDSGKTSYSIIINKSLDGSTDKTLLEGLFDGTADIDGNLLVWE
jgi:hypothetical protein